MGNSAMVKPQRVAEFVHGNGLQVEGARKRRSGSGEWCVRIKGDVRVKHDGR